MPPANRKPSGHSRSSASSQSPRPFLLWAPGAGPPLPPHCEHLLRPPSVQRGVEDRSPLAHLVHTSWRYPLLTRCRALHHTLILILILFSSYHSLELGAAVSHPGTEVLRAQNAFQDHGREGVFARTQVSRFCSWDKQHRSPKWLPLTHRSGLCSMPRRLLTGKYRPQWW